MSAAFTEEQLVEYREAFSRQDRDNTGRVDAAEAGAAMRSLGQDPSEAELATMVDGAGTVDFDGFLEAMANRQKEAEFEQEMIQAFRVFDRHGNGLLTASEVRQVMMTLGSRFSDEQVDEMITQADIDGDGRVDYEEFVMMVLAK